MKGLGTFETAELESATFGVREGSGYMRVIKAEALGVDLDRTELPGGAADIQDSGLGEISDEGLGSKGQTVWVEG